MLMLARCCQAAEAPTANILSKHRHHTVITAFRCIIVANRKQMVFPTRKAGAKLAVLTN